MERLRDRACRSRPIIVLGAFALLILYSLLSSGSRAVEWFQQPESRGVWKLETYASTLRWVEQRTRGLETVGWLELEAAPTGYEAEKLTADVRHIIVPTWIEERVAPISLVPFREGSSRDEIREQLKALGYRTIWMHPLSQVAVAETGRPRPASRRFQKITGAQHAGAGLRLGLLALVPVAGLWLLTEIGRRRRRRRGEPSVGRPHDLRVLCLVLLAVPFTLALATAIGKALSSQLPSIHVTLAAYACLIALWCVLVSRLPPEDDGQTGEETFAVLGFRRGALWLSVCVALFGAASLLLRLGWRSEGMIDAIAMYNARARAIVLDPTLLGPFTAPAGVNAMHPDYPPALAFAVAGAYQISGVFTSVAPIFVQLCLWIGGVGVLFSWARRVAGAPAGLTVLALAVLLPHWQDRITDQCCDVPIGLTYMAALSLWYSRRSLSLALACGILLGCVLLTKNEGALLVIAWLGAMLVTTPRSLFRAPRRTAVLLLGLVPAVFLNMAFTANVPPNDVITQLSWDNVDFERNGVILRRFFEILVWPGVYAWTFAWVALGCAALAARRFRAGLRGDVLLPAPEILWTLPLTLALALAGYFSIYAATSLDIEWYLRTSSDRLFAQLFPTTILLGIAAARHLAREPIRDAILEPYERKPLSRQWSNLAPAPPQPAEVDSAATPIGTGRR